ncbi:hypothetical protein [Streptomyces sp. SID13031]|uniref:hypothetical protein n=1 Tax=Streptomyces sp. SID13031 TaxID=2706046 RepID=UPI0013C8D630|nr:hypothetical protein [Streptomyces sp. SID13031]NEA32123.1 hypothetical protein [Streptomyces sp. SID13031]
MTDDLKERFQNLVADPPPPTAIPSQAVFARVRTVRRRRTAGVAVTAAAAVAVVTVLAGGLTDIHSSPPVSNQPSTVPMVKPSVPAPAKIGAAVTLLPTLKGRSLTMKVTVAGTVLVPLGADDHKQLPTNVGLIDLGLGSDYNYGDGSEPGGSDGGAVTCQGAKTRKAGKETYTLLDAPHTFTKAGTYTFSYSISFCGGRTGSFTASKTVKIVVP